MIKNSKIKLKPVWVIRESIGYKGLQEEASLNEGIIAIGWNKLGDLSTFVNNESKLREHIENTYSDMSNSEIGDCLGKVTRFINVIKKGDFVVLPCHTEAIIRIGKICGNYDYRPNDFANYNDGLDEGTEIRNIRKVEWQIEVPKSEIDESANRSLNSPHCLYKVNDVTNKYIQHLYHKSVSNHDTD